MIARRTGLMNVRGEGREHGDDGQGFCARVDRRFRNIPDANNTFEYVIDLAHPRVVCSPAHLKPFKFGPKLLGALKSAAWTVIDGYNVTHLTTAINREIFDDVETITLTFECTRKDLNPHALGTSRYYEAEYRRVLSEELGPAIASYQQAQAGFYRRNDPSFALPRPTANFINEVTMRGGKVIDAPRTGKSWEAEIPALRNHILNIKTVTTWITYEAARRRAKDEYFDRL